VVIASIGAFGQHGGTNSMRILTVEATVL